LIEPRQFDEERIKVMQWKKDLGEFSVISAEYLDAVGAIQILV
jgi:hypothetical protein